MQVDLPLSGESGLKSKIGRIRRFRTDDIEEGVSEEGTFFGDSSHRENSFKFSPSAAKHPRSGGNLSIDFYKKVKKTRIIRDLT